MSDDIDAPIFLAMPTPSISTFSITIDNQPPPSDQLGHSFQVARSKKLALVWKTADATAVRVTKGGRETSEREANGRLAIDTADSTWSLVAVNGGQTSAPRELDIHVHEDHEAVSSHVIISPLSKQPPLKHAALAGILGDKTDAVYDAEVIMTAALLGYCWERLSAGKSAKFDYEVKFKEGELVLSEDEKKDKAIHEAVIAKLNAVLKAGGLKSGAAEIGITPFWGVGEGKTMRIVGGTGDLDPGDKNRYIPKEPEGLAATLYKTATGSLADKEGNLIPVGYQGFGAYTGFITGRKNGQTGLLCTFRHVIPSDAGYGRRWLPKEITPRMLGAPLKVPALGDGDTERKVWGMIQNNKGEAELKSKDGMHFEGVPEAGDIVGYTHGMIQAIYDVLWRGEGTPFEIAVGKKTTKLSSCFPCSIFMEATGFPASSTHLGKGASWALQYPKAVDDKGVASEIDDPYTRKPLSTQHAAYQKGNLLFYQYSAKILKAGLACLKAGAKHVQEKNGPSVEALDAYLSKQTELTAAGNLILDAITIQQSEAPRVDGTLKL